MEEGARTAFEFRHPSWLDDRVHAALADRNVALCLADTDEEEAPRVATADWGYLRLRRESYEREDLSRWMGWVSKQGWGEAFVFFKHEDAGAGPRLARQALELAEDTG